MSSTPKPSQRRRHIGIATPLGHDVLLLNRFTLRERLSAPFEIEVDLSSVDPNIDYKKVVGFPTAIRLHMGKAGTRYFHGHVSRFVQVAGQGHYARYRATIVPWIWFLTRTSDCRVFQRKSVLDIAENVFNGHRFGSEFYDLRLKDRYPKRRYCVQYRETDFNYISRLLESEGIYYWFDHTQKSHRLVLADGIGASKPAPGFEKLKFNPVQLDAAEGRTDIVEWTVQQEVQPVRYQLKDFDFKKPSDPLMAGHDIPREHGMARFAMYDYPGEYYEPKDAKRYAQLRLEELQVRYEVIQGVTGARGLAAGTVFELADHPRKDQNRKYLITELNLTADAGEFESGGNVEDFFSCHFTAIPSKTPYRPQRVTPKPIIQGIQTATVVGEKGKEVDPDDYGRVKVQFHWDRYGKMDENSSCWVRVSQPWAGKGYGGMNIPRIGQEVVVEFIEGDPDRPLINGRLYHAENMPNASNAGRDGKPGNRKPSGLSKAGMMTSFKSSSLGGSGGSNEITMNDEGGKEGLFLKAQKDEIHNVGNDREDSVSNNESRKVGVDRTREVGNNEKVTIGNNRTKDVGVDETVTIGSNHTVSVGANESITIGANRSVTVGANENYTVKVCRMLMTMLAHNDLAGVMRGIETGVVRIDMTGMAMADIVGLARFTLVGLADMQVTGLNKIEQVGQNFSLKAGQSVSVKPSKDFIVEAGANAGIKAGSMLVIEAPDITLKAPGGFIRIDASGVTIQGKPKIKLNSGGSAGSLPGAADAAAAAQKKGDAKGGGDSKGDAPAKPGATDAAKAGKYDFKTQLGKFLDKIGVPEKYAKVLDQLLDNPFEVSYADLKAIAPTWEELIKKIPANMLPEKLRGPLANLIRYLQASQFAPENTPAEIAQNEKDAKAALEALQNAIKNQGKSELEAAIKQIAQQYGIDLSSISGDDKKPSDGAGGKQPATRAGGSSSGGTSSTSNLVDPSSQGGSSGPTEPGFDPNAAADYATDHAGSAPGGNCASAVREAIEAGGIEVAPTGSAKDYGPNLETAGFQAVQATEDTYVPQKGDVVVFQNCTGHPDGHMQIYNGSHFVSDFTQNDALWPSSSPTSAWKTEKPSFTVYRHP